MSRKSSDSDMPNSCAKRTKSSLTTSGTFVLISDEALPKEAGKPVERDIEALASDSLKDMLSRLMKRSADEFEQWAQELRANT